MGWHLTGSPWAVQVEARRRSEGKAKFGYFMEMGLGKTSLVLNEFIEFEHVSHLIVVSPQTFKLDWVQAPSDWGVGFLDTWYWPQHWLPPDGNQGIYVVNYEAVGRSQLYKPLLKFCEQNPVMLVLDESKALGNPQSGWSRHSLELAKRAQIVRLLNGTPVTQSPMDLYGQLRALGELNGWTSVDFRNRFAVQGGFMGKQLLPEIRDGEVLAGIMDRCSFRATKAEWRKDLPEKTYHVLHLEMNDRQERHYREMLNEFYTLVNDETAVSAEMVLAQMLKLQQITSGFVIDSNRTAHRLNEPSHNVKIRAAADLSAGAGKLIIVYVYRESGAMLFEHLSRHGFNPAWIRGGLSPEEVAGQKHKFNNDSTCRVILGQERAIALGHTLLGQPGNDRCSRTMFYENSFSLYYRLQAEDRNHRGEQDQMCTVYDCVSSPIEQAAIDILKSKNEMSTGLDTIIAAVRKEREQRFYRRTK